MSAVDLSPQRFGLAGYVTCLTGIAWREVLRFLHQRERFLSALVRPLVWLFIFAAGFRQVLGVSIIPPYQTYVLYEVFVTPGLVGMIQLFNAMQTSLSMVYDRETGVMRTLRLVPPARLSRNAADSLPCAKLSVVFASSALSVLTAVAF